MMAHSCARTPMKTIVHQRHDQCLIESAMPDNNGLHTEPRAARFLKSMRFAAAR